jgi:hypothetical protein
MNGGRLSLSLQSQRLMWKLARRLADVLLGKTEYHHAELPQRRNLASVRLYSIGNESRQGIPPRARRKSVVRSQSSKCSSVDGQRGVSVFGGVGRPRKVEGGPRRSTEAEKKAGVRTEGAEGAEGGQSR